MTEEDEIPILTIDMLMIRLEKARDMMIEWGEEQEANAIELAIRVLRDTIMTKEIRPGPGTNEVRGLPLYGLFLAQMTADHVSAKVVYYHG